MFIQEDEKNQRLLASFKQDEVQVEESDSLQIESHRFRGRSKGAKGIPDFLRPIIGASVKFSGLKETQEAFGVSHATASTLANGKVTYCDTTREVPELQSKVDEIVGNAQEKAAERLMSALGFITDDKLAQAKARDLSGIAADMSRVIEKTSPKSANLAGANIVIYAPVQKSEDSYEVIEVGKKQDS